MTAQPQAHSLTAGNVQHADVGATLPSRGNAGGMRGARS